MEIFLLLNLNDISICKRSEFVCLGLCGKKWRLFVGLVVGDFKEPESSDVLELSPVSVFQTEFGELGKGELLLALVGVDSKLSLAFIAADCCLLNLTS
jgi:hypothetical protein